MTLLSLLSGRSLRLVSRKYRESPISIYGNYISNACFDIRGRDSDILFIDLMKIEYDLIEDHIKYLRKITTIDDVF